MTFETHFHDNHLVKPLFNEFSKLCYYFTSFNLSNVGEFF